MLDSRKNFPVSVCRIKFFFLHLQLSLNEVYGKSFKKGKHIFRKSAALSVETGNGILPGTSGRSEV
jgi:hypothetical protein